VFALDDQALPKLPVGIPSTGLPLSALQGLASRDGMARALARSSAQLTSLGVMTSI
jgi:hypothetical protein